MRGLKPRVKIHPLFWAVLLLSAFTGKLLLLLAATFAALEHELAHAVAARRMGFTLDRIVLMPYGAVISGDIGGISPLKEIWVCLAGPLANALTALAFVALWWLFPETYPYTEAAAQVSASLFFVNLLPAYPLDGGRIFAILLRPLGERKGRIVCRAVGAAIALALIGLFVYSCFSEPNFGALVFALLLAAGGWGGGSYRRIEFAPKDFSRGVEERRVALSAERTAGEAMRYLREDKYLVLVLFDKGEFVGELAEEELLSVLESGGYNTPLSSCLSPSF